MRLATRLAAATTAVGIGGLAYSLWEAHQFTLRHGDLPILPADSPPLTLLHLTDLHITPAQRDKAQWLASLINFEPDLVIGTGDFIADPASVDFLRTALGPLLDRPGAFVLGSNDYYSPMLKNPLKYFSAPSNTADREIDLPWQELSSALSSGGWLDLDNRAGELTVGEVRFGFKGVDDPHIGRDDLAAVDGPWPSDADVRVGVAHAPYLRILEGFADMGADAIIAGHTHGGQVCVPGFGALVTNCDLDRRYAKGIHQHAGSWVHVSAGLGTNPYTPVRFACRPEASLLTLTSRRDPSPRWPDSSG